MVYIHLHLGKRLQDHLSQIPVDLVRGHRILLVPSSGIHLKCNVLIRIDLVHVIPHMLLQVLIILVINLDHGADIRNTEYPFQGFHGVIIIIFPFCFYVNTA